MNLKLLSHKLTAYFQAILSVIFITGYFFVLFMFLLGKVKVPGEYHDMTQTLIGFLTGALSTVIAFWFSRQRTSSDDPHPGTTTVTSSATVTPQ